ncbi:hypothetical protein [Sphingorhabdus sp. YGSMI21]|nr:hypothetical protein [Sphingorhabdus sp. YGSMI21]
MSPLSRAAETWARTVGLLMLWWLLSAMITPNITDVASHNSIRSMA